MRVLHVVEVEHGGVVTYVRELARLQAAEGHDVHVLAPPAAGAFAGTVHQWHPRRRSVSSLLTAHRRLRALVAHLEPDVTHLHSFFPGLLGRARPLPGAVVHQPHGWPYYAAPRPLEPLLTRAEKHGLRHTDAMLVNCEAEGAEGRRRGLRVSPHVVGVPLDVEHFSPGAGSTPPGLSDLDERAIVVCVGRISPVKGQLQLVRQWEATPVPGCVLVLVGAGDPETLREAAPSAFGSSIVHVGAQHDVRPFLRSALVSVLPSVSEGQSVAMAESLACGVPVVMTDVNGAREAILPVGGDAAGSVVPPGDMVALLGEVARRVADPVLVEAERRHARGNAMAMFSPSIVLQRVDAAYRAAVDAASTDRDARRACGASTPGAVDVRTGERG